jgi:hypothetical protein
VDAVIRSERGQALVVCAAIIGLAALAVSALLGAQERLLAEVALQRAGEAAVAAAGAAVADLELAYARELGRDLVSADIERLAADERVGGAARLAADRMAAAHGVAAPESVVLRAFGSEFEVHLALRGRPYVVLLAPPR